MPLFTSGSPGHGLGLVILVLVLVLRIWSCLHHCQTPQLVGLAVPLPRTLPCFRPSASIFGPSASIFVLASFGSLFQQSSFPPMHRGLDKTLVVPIFGAKECVRTYDFVLKIYKKSGGRDPRTTAAEGETFVHTHPRAHLPDAGVPPLLLGWLRPCIDVPLRDIQAPFEMTPC